MPQEDVISEENETMQDMQDGLRRDSCFRQLKTKIHLSADALADVYEETPPPLLCAVFFCSVLFMAVRSTHEILGMLHIKWDPLQELITAWCYVWARARAHEIQSRSDAAKPLAAGRVPRPH